MHQDPPPLYNGAVVGIAFMETEKLFAHKHFWLYAFVAWSKNRTC